MYYVIWIFRRLPNGKEECGFLAPGGFVENNISFAKRFKTYYTAAVIKKDLITAGFQQVEIFLKEKNK